MSGAGCAGLLRRGDDERGTCGRDTWSDATERAVTDARTRGVIVTLRMLMRVRAVLGLGRRRRRSVVDRAGMERRWFAGRNGEPQQQQRCKDASKSVSPHVPVIESIPCRRASIGESRNRRRGSQRLFVASVSS
jgi:hypothetical protein